MADSSLTRRYATALYDIAVRRGSLQKIAEDVNLLQDAFKASPRLLAVLGSPEVAPERKNALLQSLFGAQVDPLTLQFCNLLVNHRRADLLEDLQPVFSKLADQAAGIIRARVETAVPMTPDQEQRIRQQLSQLTGKNVIVTSTVDTSLRGGAVVWLGDRVIDGSVRGYLDSIQQRIL